MTDLESRYLGPFVLDGDSGGGSLDARVDFEGAPVTVRVEIDYPDRLSAAVVHDVDMVIEHLDFLDGLGRDTIEAGLSRDDSAPARLFRAWSRRRDAGASAEDFLAALRPTRLTILPDGGVANRDRVVLVYGVPDDPQHTVTVRFVEPTGPELDPAPRSGFDG